MRKLILGALFVSQAFALKCDYPKQFCLKIVEEPMYKRLYLINMSNEKVMIKQGNFFIGSGSKTYNGRVFNRYSKTVLDEIKITVDKYGNKKSGWMGYENVILKKVR